MLRSGFPSLASLLCRAKEKSGGENCRFFLFWKGGVRSRERGDGGSPFDEPTPEPALRKCENDKRNRVPMRSVSRAHVPSVSCSENAGRKAEEAENHGM